MTIISTPNYQSFANRHHDGIRQDYHYYGPYNTPIGAYENNYFLCLLERERPSDWENHLWPNVDWERYEQTQSYPRESARSKIYLWSSLLEPNLFNHENWRHVLIYPVDPSNWNLVLLGLKYGVRINPNPSTYKNSIRCCTDFGVFKAKNYQNFFYTIPNFWEWRDSQAELDCISHIQIKVKEGLLEIPRHIHRHHHDRKTLLSEAVKTEANTQYLVSQTETAAQRAKEAATEAVKLEMELNRMFVNANNLQKTLEVCKKYFEGQLGIDWFVRDLFDPIFQPKHHEFAENRLNDRAKRMAEIEHDGPVTPLPGSRMKPLFKRYPNLALAYSRLYGNPED